MAIVYGTCTGSSASKYTVWINYTIGSYSIPNNSTPVNVKEYVQRNDGYANSAYDLVADNYTYVKYDNGNEIGGYTTIDTRNSAVALLRNTDYTIYHNADGTRSITLQAGFTIHAGTLTGGTVSSGSIALPTIPRYAVINSFTVSKASGVSGLTQFSCAWSTDTACDDIEYSISGGTWTQATGSGTSGTFTIGSLSPATQYSIVLRVKRTDSQLWTSSSAVVQTTYDIAKLTTGTNFTDEENPVLTYTNPSGAVLNAKLEFDGVSIQRDTLSASPYTFELTSEERTTLLSHTPNSNTMTVRQVIVTEVGGTETYTNYIDYIMTVVNADPTFTAFTIADINATTLALTDNDTKIIDGYSNVAATITASNKAVAIKGSSMVSYDLIVGVLTDTAAYSDASTVTLSIDNIKSKTCTVCATDGRGNCTDVVVEGVSLIEYTPPSTMTMSALRTDGIEEETTLSFSGSWWGNSFGTVTNSMTATYKYKEINSSTWIDGTTTITPTTDATTFSFTDTIIGDTLTGFDATFSYNVEVTVIDELDTLSKSYVLESGTPVVAVHAEGVAVMQTYDDTLDPGLQVSGKIYLNGTEFTGGGSAIRSMTQAEFDVLVDKSGTIFVTDGHDMALDLYPINSTYMTTSTNNPTALFGGTWEQQRTYYGGELLAYGVATTTGAGSSIAANASTAFSASAVGTKQYEVVNYVAGILTGSGGTFLLQTLGIIGMVEATCYLCGLGATGLRGFWWQDNSNTLPTGVTQLATQGSNVLTTGPIDANYGGNSNSYIYKIDTTTNTSFYVNPLFVPYGGAFTPSSGGTKSHLLIKVFAKHGTTYQWKRTA